MFKTVLFPVDQSREAREAAEKVVNIVKTYASRLVILSVVEPPAEEGDAPPSEVMTSPEAVAKLLSELPNRCFPSRELKLKSSNGKANLLSRFAMWLTKLGPI